MLYPVYTINCLLSALLVQGVFRGSIYLANEYMNKEACKKIAAVAIQFLITN